jgi:hypothetical protein
LSYTQNGDDPQEESARFGYKLNMKIKFLNHHFIFLANYLNEVGKSGYFSKIFMELWLLKI